MKDAVRRLLAAVSRRPAGLSGKREDAATRPGCLHRASCCPPNGREFSHLWYIGVARKAVLQHHHLHSQLRVVAVCVLDASSNLASWPRFADAHPGLRRRSSRHPRSAAWKLPDRAIGRASLSLTLLRMALRYANGQVEPRQISARNETLRFECPF